MTGLIPVTWSRFIDYGTGIAGYAAGVISAPDLQFLNSSGFIQTELSTSARINMTLDHATVYYSVVETWDRVGNRGFCLSNGFLFDATPPVVSNGTVRSLLALGRNPRVQRNRFMVHAELGGFYDPESGVRGVMQAAIGPDAQTPEAHREWRATNNVLLATGIYLPDDGWFTLSVRVANYAYEESLTSFELGLDTKPPWCSPISINGIQPGEFQTVHFTQETNRLDASWVCGDYEPWASEGVDCTWQVGTFPGGDDHMRPLAVSDSHYAAGLSSANAKPAQASYVANGTINRPLQNGVIYFVTVTCVDHVGWKTSTVSDGVMPDLEPPRAVAPAYFSHPTTNRVVRFTGSALSYIVGYSFIDHESGLSWIGGAVTTYANFSGPDALQFFVSTDPRIRRAVVPHPDPTAPLTHASQYFLHMCAGDYENNTVCNPPAVVTVDLTPPECETPVDLVLGRPAGPFVSRKAGIGARWRCWEDISSVEFTNWYPMVNDSGSVYSLLPARNEYRVKSGHRVAGGSASTAIRLIDGARYFSCVTGTNSPGNASVR